MAYTDPSHEEMINILHGVKTIALIGASDDPDRPAHHVMAYLMARGYQVFPVNPRMAGKELFGCPVYASLLEIKTPIDMVDLFVNSKAALEVTQQAIEKEAKILWMQLGVINHEAADQALARGLKVIMNHCPVIELEQEGLA
ncbi:MAG: CoA-binding protein [Alphaproteobacteria bacterium]|nr:CoA-binding protein [Alphaproteobacteria bacterium]